MSNIIPQDPGAKLLMWLSIIVILMQLSGNYGMFVRIPEDQKVLLSRMDLLQNDMTQNALRHVELTKDMKALQDSLRDNYGEHTRMWTEILQNSEKSKAVDFMQRDQFRQQQLYELMTQEDKAQWNAIRKSEMKINSMAQDFYKGSKEQIKENGEE